MRDAATAVVFEPLPPDIRETLVEALAAALVARYQRRHGASDGTRGGTDRTPAPLALAAKDGRRVDE